MLESIPGGQPLRKPVARCESPKVVAIRSTDSGPTPGGAQVLRPQLVQRTTAVANRRMNSILPETKQRLLYAIDQRLRKVAFEFEIDNESMDQMLRERLDQRRIERMTRRRAA